MTAFARRLHGVYTALSRGKPEASSSDQPWSVPCRAAALESKGEQRHVFLRTLLALSQEMTAPLFIKSIERARRYGITTLETIERIALVQMREGAAELPLADVD